MGYTDKFSSNELLSINKAFAQAHNMQNNANNQIGAACVLHD